MPWILLRADQAVCNSSLAFTFCSKTAKGETLGPSYVFSGQVHSPAYVCGLQIFRNILEFFKVHHGHIFPQFVLLRFLVSLLLSQTDVAASDFCDIKNCQRLFLKNALNISLYAENLHWVMSVQTTSRRELFRDLPAMSNNDCTWDFWGAPTLVCFL